MPTLLYGNPTDELTAEEQLLLKESGIDLTTTVNQDLVAETAVQFAAIIESSLTIKEAARRMKKPESQVRQMIARRTLYSILLDTRRYIPLFQFKEHGGLQPNITKVNAALSADLHPVEVFEWYTKPDPNLYLGDAIEPIISPIAWLVAGGDYQTLVTLARHQ